MEFKSSFVKDLKKIKAKRMQSLIMEIIAEAEISASISEISSVKNYAEAMFTTASDLAIIGSA